MSKKGKREGEPRAIDGLPADGPSPVDPTTVTPADASLQGAVETRKIGIRRVSSLGFSDRFVDRARWRPAGNSRGFWSKIETDDPFMAQPARPVDATLEIYPSQRLPRVEGSLPKPQPDIAREYTPRPSDDAPPPRPAREVKRPSRQTPPEQRHTPDPRPAPTPRPRQDRAEEEEEAPAPPKPVRRLPPRKPTPEPSRSRTGRQRMPSRGGNQATGPQKSAAEIREEKRLARVGGEKKAERSVDDYRDFMQQMMFLRDKYEAGEEIPEIIDATITDDDAIRRPKPVTEASRPAPKAEPTPAPEPVDRTPPRATPPNQPPVKERSAPGGGAGGLDDLFGAGDRVRMGRRTKPSSGDGESG